MTQSLLLLLPCLLILTACGPIPLAQAERQCAIRARDASGPHGEVAVGIGNGKARSRVRVDLSADYLLGRDPEAVYNQCVLNASGQMPARPLAFQPGWRG
ncbi:hypothetical protein [Pseudorhodobacter sp.]|uniref:hypothetical protein n=1 Tax=Pseudorhodobacter sp. TaxID=1934400 RepID=UPI002649449B|nr:hypothetical protein [Pseudorhodobacter sp.]MDN5787758.1 hypothetical protein [Pseudorhodobacter sp.]